MPDLIKYLSKLHQSRVLVIGGSSGIGYCVAEACVEHGAIVTVSSSNKERVGKAVERLKESYPSATERIFGVPVDLLSPDSLEDELKTLLESTKEKLEGQKLDHVVFTAGNAIPTIMLEDMVRSECVR
jgi:NAD(P)-dependent dehydrogenase (short-subunit alcohol dehydrogenase family)